MTNPQFGNQGSTTNSYQQPAYAAPVMSPEAERTAGMLAHLIPLVAMVVSGGVLGFVASLVLYFVYRDRGPFVRENAANSLNVQIITAIVLVISIPLMIVFIGFITYPAAIVFAFVVHVIGAMKANRGLWWKPPMTPRFVR